MFDTNPLSFLTWRNLLPAREGEQEGGSAAAGGSSDTTTGTDAGKGVLSQASRGDAGNTGEPPAGDEAGAGEGGAPEGGQPTDNGDQGQQPAIPEQYEFNFEQTGLELTDQQRELYDTTFRELGLGQEQVNQLIAAEEQLLQSMAEERQTQVDNLMSEWTEAAKADKYLGQDWDLTMNRVSAGLEAAGVSGEFMELLDSSGLSSHPEMIKMAAMLGQVTSNDRFESGAPSEQRAAPHQSWYEGTTPQSKKG